MEWPTDSNNSFILSKKHPQIDIADNFIINQLFSSFTTVTSTYDLKDTKVQKIKATADFTINIPTGLSINETIYIIIKNTNNSIINVSIGTQIIQISSGTITFEVSPNSNSIQVIQI